MQERTLFMIKPDAVRKKVVGKIITMVEHDFHIVDMKMKRFSREEAEKFYEVHREKEFFEGLVEFITSGPTVGLLLEGDNVVERVRKLVGSTDPKEAKPGTVRFLYGSSIRENAVHASDSPASAELEIAIFFGAP